LIIAIDRPEVIYFVSSFSRVLSCQRLVIIALLLKRFYFLFVFSLIFNVNVLCFKVSRITILRVTRLGNCKKNMPSWREGEGKWLGIVVLQSPLWVRAGVRNGIWLLHGV